MLILAFEYNSDIRNLYQFPCDEARVLAELHQLVYNQLMSSQGPYSKLTKNGEHIEKGYASIKLQRRNLVDRKKAAYKVYKILYIMKRRQCRTKIYIHRYMCDILILLLLIIYHHWGIRHILLLRSDVLKIIFVQF